jgi:hypothetical protein
MRKILIIVLILIVTMSILWVFAGQRISSFVDEFKTLEVRSDSVHSISYEGSGDGGILVIDGARFDLAPLNPHVGSTKDNQLALSYEGKVFPFGPIHSSDDANLTTGVSGGDDVSLIWKHSYLIWLNPKEGIWRNGYDVLIWTKPNGAKLNIVWRTRSSWTHDSWFRETEPTRGTSERIVQKLIRIDISNPVDKSQPISSGFGIVI